MSPPSAISSSSSSISTAEKREFIKNICKLKHQENIFEKEIENFFTKINTGGGEKSELHEIITERARLCIDREKMVSKYKELLSDIIHKLTTAKKVISDPQDIQTLDTNKYKTQLLHLSRKIHEIKQFFALQTLIEEQKILETDLQNCRHTLQETDDEDAKNKYKKLRSVISSKNKGDMDLSYQTAQDFTNLVATTGHTENWPEEDHLYFLKMRKKYDNNLPSVIIAIQKKFPDLTKEAIINHESWYKLYLELREKQRKSVEQWRNRKKNEKLKNVDNSLDLYVNCNECKPIKSCDTTQGKIENCNFNTSLDFQRNSGKREIPTKKGNDENVGKKKKELIEQWKIERENKKLMDEETIEVTKKSRKQLKEHRRLIRSEKLMERLLRKSRGTSKDDNCSESNFCNNFTSTETKNPKLFKRKTSYSDQFLIKSFRKQDEEFIRKRKRQIQKSKRKEDPLMNGKYIQRRNSNSTSVTMKLLENSSTICNSTINWNLKCRSSKDDDENDDRFQKKSLLYIKDVPKLLSNNRWRTNEESFQRGSTRS